MTTVELIEIIISLISLVVSCITLSKVNKFIMKNDNSNRQTAIGSGNNQQINK